MPSVGTLNLTVESNASQVGGSLEEIAGALGRIKRALPENGLGLTAISAEVKKFVGEIKEIQNASSVFKQIEQLGNGMQGIAKAVKYSTESITGISKETNKAISNINADPLVEAIEKIKGAVGTGFHIGQTGTQLKNIKQALSEEWNITNAFNAGYALTAIAEGAKSINGADMDSAATKVKNIADALNEYAKATENVKHAIGNTTSTKADIASSVSQATASSWTEFKGLSRWSFMGSSPQYGSGWNPANPRDYLYNATEQLHESNEKINEATKKLQITDAVVQQISHDTDSVVGKFNSIQIDDSIASPIEAINGIFRDGANNIRYYGSALDAILPKINALSSEEMIEAGNARLAAMGEKELKVAIAEASGVIKKASTDVKPVIQLEQIESVQQFNIELRETGDVIESVVIPRFAEMYRIWSEFSHEFGAFQHEGFRLMAPGADFNMPVDPGNMLSTYVGNYFENMWTNWKPDFVMDNSWLQNMYQQMVDMYNQFGWFNQSGPALGPGTEPLRLYGEVAEKVAGQVSGAIDGVETASRVIDETKESTHAAAVTLDDFYESLNKIDLLKQLRSTLTAELGKGILTGTFDDKKIINYQIRIQNLTDQINKLEDAERRASDEAVNVAKEKIGEFMDKNEIELTRAKLDAMTDAIARQYAAGKLNETQFIEKIKTLQTLRDKLEELTEAEEQASSFTGRIGSAFNALKGGIEKLFPTLTSMIKRFGQIAKYRLLRSVIRHITAGFTEGVKNVYQYSKAVGTDLAPAMDSAATALLKMKNSIGAAAAPLIQALVPVLQTVVGWVVQAINYLNQFFAILNGQTSWTMAIDYATEAYEDNTNAARSAQKAAKDLLADWDELNIIQSNSGTAGTGSNNQNTPDYSQMFQEVNEFSQSVKDTVKFLEDHLGGIVSIIKKVGALILGWKFSKAFTGFLSSLGKLVAGGALVAIGLDFTYGGGFEAGSRGFFDTKDIISIIGGTLATAIGGSLITTGLGLGGGIGFGIGIGVAIIATLAGYISGRADFMDKMKWGNEEWTPQQIEDYIRSKFSFDIDAEIELLDANIANRENAEATLTKAVNDFTSSLTFATMKVGVEPDAAPDAILAARDDAFNVIEVIQSYIDENEKALTTTLSISPMKDGEGNDITSDILSQVMVADKTLKQYFIDLGKELADAVYQGEQDGWTEGEMENALALMEHQRNIIARAEEMERDLTFQMNFSFNLNELTRDNAKEVIEKEKALIEEYKERFMKDRETAKAAAIKELSWTEAAIEDYKEKGLDTTDLEAAAATYRQLINEYLDPEKAEADWNLKMQEAMASMRTDWINALKGNYGLLENEYKENRMPLAYKSPATVFTNDLIDASKDHNPIAAASKALKEYFDTIKKLQPDYIQEVMDTMNLNVWDIADKEMKEGLARVLRDVLGNDYAASVLQSLNVPISEIESLFGDGYKYNPNNLVPKAADAVVEQRGILSYTPPTEQIEDLLATAGIVVTIDDIDVTISENVFDNLQREIENAMSDHRMTEAEKHAIVQAYGLDLYDWMMNYLDYNLDEEGWSTGSARTPIRVSGGISKSDIGWGNNAQFATGGTGVVATEPANNQQDVDNVAAGTARGTSDLLDALNSILRVAEAINRKEFTINLRPTSDWGRHNSRSDEAYDKVIG